MCVRTNEYVEEEHVKGCSLGEYTGSCRREYGVLTVHGSRGLLLLDRGGSVRGLGLGGHTRLVGGR